MYKIHTRGFHLQNLSTAIHSVFLFKFSCFHIKPALKFNFFTSVEKWGRGGDGGEEGRGWRRGGEGREEGGGGRESNVTLQSTYTEVRLLVDAFDVCITVCRSTFSS